jgi:SAM-dependent methyltransferase
MKPRRYKDRFAASGREELYDVYISTGMGSASKGDGTPPGLARYLKATIHPRLPSATDARIADLGCGGGDLLASLRAIGYSNLAGVDLSTENVARCHARGMGFVTRGDALDFLAHRVAEFDCLVAMDVFEHLELPKAIEVARAAVKSLRPGGRMLIQTCNATSPVFGSVRYADLTHVTAFTPLSVRQLLLAAGFQSVQVHSVVPVGRTAAGLMRRAVWELMSGMVRLYLTVETGQRGHIVSRNLVALATI